MKFCSINWKTASLLVSCFFCSTVLLSQVSSLSPYSRFGLGQLLEQGGTVNRGMGGVTAPLADRFFVNSSNPASYPFLYRTTYDLNVRASFLQLETSDQTANLVNGSLNSAQFGFKKQGSRVGFGLGLRPFSTTGYEISITENDENLGDLEYSYQGEGGINQAHAGVGFRLPISACKALLDKRGAQPDTIAPRHTIAVGVNLDYYFGQLGTTRRLRYFESGYYDTRISAQTDVGSLNATLGLTAILNLFNRFEGQRIVSKTNLYLSASASPARDFTVGYEEVNESVFTTSLGAEFVTDTASYQPFTEGQMSIPMRMNVGFSLNHIDRESREWRIAGDILYQDWSSFTSDFNLLDGVTELQAYQRISLGMELTPRPLSDNAGAFLKSSYRFGLRMTDSYLTLKDHRLSEQAVSSGISLPVSQSKSASKFHLGIEFGSRGTTENNLIRERFVNAFVGFSFSPIGNNNWFVERKYD